ncbi:uncharacterized protein C8R40DRAFT_249833 [Lentinula edodes]|uniref:uncharacterized protein n=1 Tax=Lentinula edodes TaxID=5353 RepID=UPI001E8D9E27|nr:uncharacterized protein C8R40DRAFT_249833 [Lentinula edodes]KAH7880396.1 hypothetical protein C8R40DRAFT_249833 [Lentinula edodes]
MVISFIPAIDEVAHVAIPEWHATDSTVELRFSAVLGDEEFQQFKKNGMKVQVWSNLPLGRRNEGEWGEIDLHEADEPASDGSSDDSQISLVALEDVKAKAENLLFAICSVPFSGSSDDYYSFTYRIVYPSGEIHWLGQFGQNGMVHINTASKNDSGIVFEEGLVANTAPFVWNTRGRQVEDLLIAQVAHPEDWSVWTVGKDSLFKGPATSASLVLLVPHVRPYAVHCPKTVLLSASSDTSISVNASGKIQATGPGSLLLQTFNPAGFAESFLDKIFAHSPSLNHRLFGVFGDYIGLTSFSAGSSVQAILVPLIPSGFVSQIDIASASLASILDTKTAEYTIFSDARPSVQFAHPESGLVRFSVPSSGGLFLLTPLYRISTISRNLEASGPTPGNHLSLSVLSPHSIAGVAPVEDTVLPTPPPSPHLHPIAHLTSPSNHSTSSISELDEQGAISPTNDIQKDAIVLESASLRTLRPPIDRDQVSVLTLTRQSSPSLLIEAHRENRQNILVAFMRHLYLALILWFSMVFRELVGGSASDVREDSPVEQSSSQSIPDTANSYGFSPVNEHTPLLSRVIPPSPVDEPLIQASAPPASVVAPVPSQTISSPPILVQFDLLDAKSGPRGLVFRDTSGSLTGDNLSDNVVVEINEQNVPLNNEVWLTKGVLYLGIDGEKPGRVNIKITSNFL